MRLPNDVERRRDGVRRVAAAHEADRHGKRKVLQRFAAEQQHCDNRDERGNRGVERTHENLVHRVVRHGGESALHRLVLHVLVDAVEHDNRIVERVAQDGEQGGDGVRGDLATDEHVDAHNDDKVMQKRDDRRHTHLRIAEADRNVGDNQKQRDEEGDCRRLDDACTPVRADRGDLEAVGGPTEGVRHLVRRHRRIFSGSRGGADEEARLAVGRRGLDDRVGLARIAERVADLLGRDIARAVEGHRRTADELDAEVHAAHADDNGD